MIKHIVVDTSYLLEFYKIGGKETRKCWSEEGHKRVKEKFDEEDKLESRFYFPIPVLFEFANHINDANNKQKVLKCLMELIEKCQTLPNYTITPCSDAEDMESFMVDLIEIVNKFTNEFNQKPLSLTNVSIIAEVQRLEKFFKNNKRMQKNNLKIHIWTKNRALKGKEPDEEENPFV